MEFIEYSAESEKQNDCMCTEWLYVQLHYFDTLFKDKEMEAQ